MSRTIVSTTGAPAAIGTYSQAVKVGDTVYLSGQIGLDPATMQMVEGIDAQIVRVFDNLKAVAEASGGSLADIVKINIFLKNFSDLDAVNEVYTTFFPDSAIARAVAYVPARTAVAVAGLNSRRKKIGSPLGSGGVSPNRSSRVICQPGGKSYVAKLTESR